MQEGDKFNMEEKMLHCYSDEWNDRICSSKGKLDFLLVNVEPRLENDKLQLLVSYWEKHGKLR